MATAAHAQASGHVDADSILRAISADQLAAAISQQSGGKASRQGNQWTVRCPNPAHPDDDPSCSVNEKNGVALWHCFPCDIGGNAITWLRLVEGTGRPFSDELKELAERFSTAIELDRSGADDDTSRKDRPPPDFKRKLKDERCDNPNLLERFITKKRIPQTVLEANGVHTAERPHKCNAGCAEPRDGWIRIPVVRVPQLTHDGVEGFQDIISYTDARAHYRNNTKRTAQDGTCPAVGLNLVRPDTTRIILTEGVTDWLTARTAAPDWVTVGALGSSQMEDAASAIADLCAERASLIVIGDGDKAGDKGAEAALGAWARSEAGGGAIRLRPQNRRDLSDAWVDGVKAGAPEGWWEANLARVIAAAESSMECDAWEMPVHESSDVRPYSGSSAAVDSPGATDDRAAARGDAHYGDGDGSDDADASLTWPNAETPTGDIWFTASNESKVWLVRSEHCTKPDLDSASVLNSPVLGRIDAGETRVIKLNRCLNSTTHPKPRALLCSARVESPPLEVTIYEAEPIS